MTPSMDCGSCKFSLILNLLAFFQMGIQNVSCVKINQFLVPQIASPAVLPVILDCDYSLEFPKDEGLVVKWFFNERMYPVYQWIPDAKPQELGILKGRLDLSYRASEDRHKVHRALKIVKLSPELAGNYTCSVSTFSSEDSKTKEMLVFVPEKTLELKYSPVWSKEDSNIICYAKEVFPKPELRLFLNNSEVENSTIRYQERNSGLWDAEISASVEELIDGLSIICELHISMTNYTVHKEAIYYQAWSPSGGMTSWDSLKLYWTFLITILFILG